MTINSGHFLLIFFVAIIFFCMGQVVGCSLGEMSGELEFKKGQQSCKVCEVEKIKTEAENGKV